MIAAQVSTTLQRWLHPRDKQQAEPTSTEHTSENSLTQKVVPARRVEFDVLKGLLIMLVVAGHTEYPGPFNRYIFWFHMPAFFMISGYFMHLNHVTNPFQDKAYLWKQCKRYVYPYFAWSILLYLLCFPENPLKYLVRILYGGHMNITVFSFPYWFINTLFISLIFIRYLHWLAAKQTSCVGRHIELITCVIFWALAHIILPLPINLPWGLNQALMAVCFIYIGYLFQKIPFKAWYILVAAVIVGIFIANRATWNFKFNMSETAFNSYWLDFLVPISFTILMYAVSLLLSKVKYVSKVLAFLGESSITIYFTHAFTMYTVHPWIPDMRVRILLAIVLGALIHYGFDKNVWLRKYFLGKS